MKKSKNPKLLILDLDNTLLDWCSMHAYGVKKSIEKVSEIIGVPYEQLCEEHKEIIDRENCIEYPFVIQQLPSVLDHYNYDFKRILEECSEPARKAAELAAYPYLKPYRSVLDTLHKIKVDFPDIKLAILTDAPHRVGLWRMYKIGILNYFDGIYGLEDPKLPIIGSEVVVAKKTLLKHVDKWMYGFVGRHRTLPSDYRKPDLRGFKNILLDFNIDKFSKEDILFVGDNVYRDVQLALDVGITSVFASYGIEVKDEVIDTLREFIPDRFIHKGIKLKGRYPKADFTLDDFSQILELL